MYAYCIRLGTDPERGAFQIVVAGKLAAVTLQRNYETTEKSANSNRFL